MPVFNIILNGVERSFDNLGPSPTVAALVAHLGLRTDRVALEQNGNIVPRAQWESTPVADSDRIELVHFVGGGTEA